MLFSWVRRPVLQLADITGDGRQEIIVSNVINGKTGTSCEVIRYDKGNDVLKSIYANPKKADAEHVGKQIKYFSGYLSTIIELYLNVKGLDTVPLFLY